MSKIKQKFWILIFCVLFVGCSQHNTNQGDVTKTNYEVTTIKWDSLEDARDFMSQVKVEILQLKTDSLHLFSQLSNEIFFDDSVFFVLTNNDNILQYKKDGTFLQQIGCKGHAKNEYINISSWNVNTLMDYVEIIDNSCLKIVRYDYKGKLLLTQEIPYIEDLVFNKAISLDENKYLIENGIQNSRLYNYTILDLNSEEEKKFIPSIIPFPDEMPIVPSCNIVHSDSIIYALAYFSDTIYEASASNIIPKYVLEGPLPHLERKDFEGITVDIDIINKLLLAYQNRKGDKSCGVINLSATDKYLMFNTYTHHVIYNKHTGKGFKIPNGECNLLNVLDCFRSYLPDSFVFQPSVLTEDEGFLEVYPQFKEMCDAIKNSEDYFLIFLTFS